MKMPVLFVGHGSPINIIEDNSYTRSLAELGKDLPRPEAILVVSAHWQTRGTYITSSQAPKTIYDFYGFPDELYEITYNAPGAPEKAALVQETTNKEIRGDSDRGIDHAAWAFLKHMYPKADFPVMEMSLDVMKAPRDHYELGKKLAPLRNQGILIIGSGNIVHNLSRINFSRLYGDNYSWAVAFDKQIAEALVNRDHSSLIEYDKLTYATAAVPTNEHYLPMLYAAALQEERDILRFTCTDMQNGSISMRSFVIED
ncbi:4,5-DOPA dioxygenase extradiol [Sporomusa malonica]|uniref:Aromatic ring-opening dioxygenase, catalytic subunit, LigB family n=1 Tax=Sporomusa malonica TaxID=112901 RepID=A0A1W1ZMQ7_9FIRM|nr:4,5-DOPA dioxygenase extradiol [Sporomusa malonica]SMC49647.1 Aromatic ring-opening dioxygenase, catalytic subunit, LigB family [Sporomusa malonica]